MYLLHTTRADTEVIFTVDNSNFMMLINLSFIEKYKGRNGMKLHSATITR